MKERILSIATCQFDVSGDVSQNLKSILAQIREAKSSQADVVHFPECSLTGYGGLDIPEIKWSDYTEIEKAILEIRALSKSLNINVILGAHHFEAGEKGKPKNSLYFINRIGGIEARYDKRILTGSGDTMDHAHYSKGEKPVVFHINRIKCGLLICHEWRYPELYREYKKLGIEIIFQSWYDGGLDDDAYKAEGILAGELIVGYTRGNAANNYSWISGSNTSSQESCFPSFMVQPDGRIRSKLTRNKPGVLVNDINLDHTFEDPSFYGRQRFLK